MNNHGTPRGKFLNRYERVTGRSGYLIDDDERDDLPIPGSYPPATQITSSPPCITKKEGGCILMKKKKIIFCIIIIKDFFPDTRNR